MAERNDLIDKRKKYLAMITTLRSQNPPPRFVYLDESYVHEHHHAEFSLQDPVHFPDFKKLTVTKVLLIIYRFIDIKEDVIVLLLQELN